MSERPKTTSRPRGRHLLRSFTGWALIVAGAAIVAWCRVKSVELTEGQALLRYAPLWAAAAVSILAGGRLVCEEWP